MFFDKFQSFDHLFALLHLICLAQFRIPMIWFLLWKICCSKKSAVLFDERKLNQGKNYSEIWPLNCNAVLWLWEPPWSLPIINNYWVKCIKNLKRILLETMKSVKKRVLLSRGTYSICSGVADRNILNPNNINTINYSNF